MENVNEATKGKEATTMKVSQEPQMTDEEEYLSLYITAATAAE